MTMISRVELVDTRAKLAVDRDENGRDIEALVLDLGVPKIIGNYLFYKDRVNLVSPNGETLIVAYPLRVDGEVLIHFSFGTDARRIGHTLTIRGLETIVRNLQTVVDLARLEEEKD